MEILNNLQNKPARLATRSIAGRKIAILGLGIENYALVKYFVGANGRSPLRWDITICDARSKNKLGEKYSVIASAAKQSRGAETTGLRSLSRTIVRDLSRRAPRNDINIKWQLGKNYNKNLDRFDILFRSPGWPLNCSGIRKTTKKSPPAPFVKGGAFLSSPMKLFFELCPTKNIIGVTGTKGKGTTASLIYEILKAAGKKVYLGGNIGIAPFEFLSKIYPAPFSNCARDTNNTIIKRCGVKKNDWVVLELSSFQLEDMKKSPRIAVITNFSSEHLAPADPNNPNYHKTLNAYLEVKLNIARWQGKNDFFVLNSKLKAQSSKLQLKTKNFKSKKIYFSKSNLITKLIGEHNKENIAAAVEVAKIVGIKDDIIKKAVAGFKGLDHRLEYVKNIKGVKYYNDTFATTPESAITALKSFLAPIILIAGGAEKNSNFKEFVREAKKSAKFIILLNGDASPRIKKELLKINPAPSSYGAKSCKKNLLASPYVKSSKHYRRCWINYPKDKIKLAYSMKEAVKEAKNQAKKGDIVLLSPACASFGMFKNYKERGELFKEEVKKLRFAGM